MASQAIPRPRRPLTLTSTQTRPGASNAAHLAFTVGLGLAGWGFLLGLTYLPELAPAPGGVTGTLPFLLFLIVIVAARAMAFRLVPESVLSLDSGFYVAAAICLGSASAGRMVALALTLDSLLRLLQAERAGRRSNERWADALAYVLYFGGMTGALLAACAWVFGVDGIYRDGPPAVSSVVSLVFAVGTTLLVGHYAIQAVQLRLRGRSFGSYLRELALPGMVSEASLLPLAAVVVFLFHEDNPLGFVLLGATYLVINFVFNRLSRATAELRRRVGELETLNSTARRLGASLELPELVETVARETLAAIAEAEILTLTHRSADGRADRLIVDCYDRERDAFARLHVERGAGAAGAVMQSGQTLYVPDLMQTELDLGPGAADGVRSWLGVPIYMYGEPDGVLAVQSRLPGAFGGSHRRLLESIGLQVASALQNAHLYEMAMVDGLTGLFVRRYFDTRIAEEVERAKRYDQPFSVIMMDIDNFKQLNDTHGHLVGDRVLRTVGGIVAKQMRGVDTAARYGGEEIAIILPRTDMVSAYNQAERIRAAIAEHRFVVDPAMDAPVAVRGGRGGGGDLTTSSRGGLAPASPASRESSRDLRDAVRESGLHPVAVRDREGQDEAPSVIGVTASFGIAAWPESAAKDAEGLVRRADKALYRAKKTGKNRVELFWGDGDSGRVSVTSVASVTSVRSV
jgi:diguanylate cyclase (GGDEF)-like protein